eukprot:3931084-Rhodomonas_salina.1
MNVHERGGGQFADAGVTLHGRNLPVERANVQRLELWLVAEFEDDSGQEYQVTHVKNGSRDAVLAEKVPV